MHRVIGNIEVCTPIENLLNELEIRSFLIVQQSL